MKNINDYIEALTETTDQLRRQADLWYQHQGLFSLAYDLFNCFEIDLGLATAGNPIKQETVKITKPAMNTVNGQLLLLIKVFAGGLAGARLS